MGGRVGQIQDRDAGGRQLYGSRRRLRLRIGGADADRRRDLRDPGRLGRGIRRRGEGRRRAVCQGPADHQAHDRRARTLQDHLARQRRRRLGRCRRCDGEGHPGHQLPRHLYRGSRRPCDAADPRDPRPPRRAGPHGARGPLGRGAAGAPEDPAAARPDAGAHRLRPCRARGGRAGQAVRPAHHRLRPVYRGDGDDRARGRAGQPARTAGAGRHHLDAFAGHRQRAADDPRRAFRPDEEDRDLHLDRARADDRRGGADQGARRGHDRRRPGSTCWRRSRRAATTRCSGWTT